MRFAPFALALVCTLVLFTGLDSTGAFDQREARDAVVAREVIRAAEPITPVLGSEPLFDKPILAYAPEIAVRWLSERPEWHSRLLRAALGVLIVIVIASIGAEHFGLRAAWFTALVTGSSLALPYTARADGTQLFATLFAWVGCAGLADALFGRRAGRDFRLMVAYVALAAALVCAGPLPALWPLGAVALYLALARTEDGWRRIRPLAGLAIVLGPALPWYGAMIERHGLEFLARVPFFPYADQARGPWYSGAVLMMNLLVVGLFPWSSLLPGAFLHAGTWWRAPRRPLAPAPNPRPDPALVRADPIARERREERSAHFFVAALVAALVPVLFYPFAPLSAALPALPAAALLCGRFLDHLFESPERVARALGHGTLMLALLGTAGGVLLAVLAGTLRDAAPELRLTGTVVFAASWLPFLAGFLGRHRLAGALIALPVTIGTPVVTLRLLPRLEGYLNTRQVASALETVAPPRASLVVVGPPAPSLRLYATRNLAVAGELDAAIERHRSSDGLTYVAFRPSREDEVARAAPGPLEILLRTPSLVLARVHP